MRDLCFEASNDARSFWGPSSLQIHAKGFHGRHDLATFRASVVSFVSSQSLRFFSQHITQSRLEFDRW